MTEQDRHDLFVELITRHQSQLYGYIFSLVRNRDDADDLFQSVGLILWSKFESFEPDTSFVSWSGQTARFVVRNFLRRKKPSVHVGEELFESLTETAVETRSDLAELYLAALNRCKSKLSIEDEELLKLRYVEDLPTREIAKRLGRPQQSVCNSLTRIRRVLFDCIRKDLARQEQAGEASS